MRIQIATYADGRSVGYDPAAQQAFDVQGAPVRAEDVVAYDRAGQLRWDRPEWRSWLYDHIRDPESVAAEKRVNGRRSAIVVLVTLAGTAVMVAAVLLLTGVIPAPSIPAKAEGEPAWTPPPGPEIVSVAKSMHKSIEGSSLGEREKGGDYVFERPEYAKYFEGTWVPPSTAPRERRYTILDVVSAGEEPPGRADILAPFLSATSSPVELKTLCDRVSEEEDCALVRLFSTRDAFLAMRDAQFRAEHPNALKTGFLGVRQPDGTFVTARDLNWKTDLDGND